MSDFDFIKSIFVPQISSHNKLFFITNPTVPHLHFSDFSFQTAKCIFNLCLKKNQRAPATPAQPRPPDRSTRPRPNFPGPSPPGRPKATPAPRPPQHARLARTHVAASFLFSFSPTSPLEKNCLQPIPYIKTSRAAPKHTQRPARLFPSLRAPAWLFLATQFAGRCPHTKQYPQRYFRKRRRNPRLVIILFSLFLRKLSYVILQFYFFRSTPPFRILVLPLSL
jgi:hypothetical protein